MQLLNWRYRGEIKRTSGEKFQRGEIWRRGTDASNVRTK
jgi:hypothetical protein